MNRYPTASRSPSSPGQARARRAHAALQTLASFPAAVLPLLPGFSCPACVAAYAGVLSALGVGFLVTERVLLPLIAVSLLFGVASIAWTIRAHGRKSPLVLAIVGAALIAGGRLVWSVPAAVYVGAAAFIVAAGWNLWLRVGAMRRRELAA